MRVIVWRCTDACGNYFASSSTGSVDLNTLPNHKSSMSNSVGEAAFKEIGMRSRCPNCKAERLPIAVEVPGVPVPDPVEAAA